MTTEREHYNEWIERHKAGIAEQLVKMGVKSDAAIRAVAAQTRFGLAQNNSVFVNIGGTVRIAFGMERELATMIRNTLPPEAFTDFDEPDVDEKSWANFEQRLQGTSGQYSREELREQRRQEVIERELNPQPKGEPTEDELRKRSEVAGFI